MFSNVVKGCTFFGDFFFVTGNHLISGMAMLAPIDVTTITVSSHTLDITVSYLATLVYIVYYIYLFPAVGIITLPILSAMVSHYLFH